MQVEDGITLLVRLDARERRSRRARDVRDVDAVRARARAAAVHRRVATHAVPAPLLVDAGPLGVGEPPAPPRHRAVGVLLRTGERLRQRRDREKLSLPPGDRRRAGARRAGPAVEQRSLGDVHAHGAERARVGSDVR